MHFGAQSRGLRAPCERFAPWVTPGQRITRFRLAADLGRMGLDTHTLDDVTLAETSVPLLPEDQRNEIGTRVVSAWEAIAESVRITKQAVTHLDTVIRNAYERRAAPQAV